MLPIIDPGWLTSPTDQTVAIELYRKLRRIFNTTAFTEVRVNDEEYFPGTYSTLSPHVAQCLLLTVLATGYEYDSDAQIPQCHTKFCHDCLARRMHVCYATPGKQWCPRPISQSLVSQKYSRKSLRYTSLTHGWQWGQQRTGCGCIEFPVASTWAPAVCNIHASRACCRSHQGCPWRECYHHSEDTSIRRSKFAVFRAKLGGSTYSISVQSSHLRV